MKRTGQAAVEPCSSILRTEVRFDWVRDLPDLDWTQFCVSDALAPGQEKRSQINPKELRSLVKRKDEMLGLCHLNKVYILIGLANLAN